MRKILCITGTRADYPRVKSVLKEIDYRTLLFEVYNGFTEITNKIGENIIN